MKDKKIKEKQERLDPKYERNLYNGMGDTDNFEKIYREWATKRTLLNTQALQEIESIVKSDKKSIVYNSLQDKDAKFDAEMLARAEWEE